MQTLEPIVEKNLTCPQCASPTLYRFGFVRGHQRHICLTCGRQFIPGHERIFSLPRPTCATCGAAMHLFKRMTDHRVFRCARYPVCHTYLRVEERPGGDGVRA
jgi:transposase-like protein